MVVALIAAGGKGSRMGCNKLLMKIGGDYVIAKTLRTFDECPLIDKVVVATDDDELREICRNSVEKPISFASAGSERQYSVANALELVCEEDIVVIHDGARPFVSADLICRCVKSATEHGSGVAAVPVYDSLKRADENMTVTATVDRTGVYRMQTPQAFLGSIIKRAHKQNNFGTDDAYLVEAMGEPVKLVMGEKGNIKLTVLEDLPKMDYRVGQGYDVHRLVEGRTLMLCGINVPYNYGLDGHSDADVAVHALMDALLGACGEGDIGGKFPDSDNQYKNISSVILLKKVMETVREKGYDLLNCDVTIVAQKPKLAPFINEMKLSLAKAMEVGADRVNVKATTTERLGFEGREEGISATAVVMLRGV